MKIIADIYYLIKAFGEEEAFRMVKEAGFDGIDYSFFAPSPEESPLTDGYLQRAAQTRLLLDKYGLVCNQAHATFGKSVYGDPMDQSCWEYDQIVRAMEYSSIIGVKHIVVHCIKPPAGVDVIAYNVEYYRSLQPYAERFGVKIAVENLMTTLCRPDDYNAALAQLDPKWFVALVDVGHSHYAKTPPETFIREVDPNRLKGLHIHDNDSTWDTHLFPYMGTIQWDHVMEALAEVGYQGDLTLETGSGFLKRFDKDLYLVALTFSADVCRHLAGKMEKFLG